MTVFALFIVLFSAFCFLTLSGCAPTYPKEKFKESIMNVCKKEYNLDVKAETVGKTIAIYVPLNDLIDFTFAITSSASEKINDVILSVSRVALSSDADYGFYCVIAHDVRIPEIQIVIIKSVDDVKRFLLNDISRGEYSKRMLVDIRVNPQSQKERAMKQVFEKIGVDKKWQEQVMGDFFQSEPTGLGDIGYWNGRFYIKDIALAEFLAEQMAGRIKLEARDDKRIAESVSIKTSKGAYYSRDGQRFFQLDVMAEPKWFKEFEDRDISETVFLLAGRVSYDVLHGYRFDEFDYVGITDQKDAKVSKITKEDLKKFKPKKVKIDDVMMIDAI